MSAIKLHIFRGDNPGIESCDFRGDNFIGSEQGDEHRTILEVDPASDELVSTVLSHAPAVNGLFQAIGAEQPDWLAKAAGLLSLDGNGPVGLRIGVWDE